MKKTKFRAKCMVNGEIVLFTDEKRFRKVVRQAVSKYYKQHPVTEKTVVNTVMRFVNMMTQRAVDAKQRHMGAYIAGTILERYGASYNDKCKGRQLTSQLPNCYKRIIFSPHWRVADNPNGTGWLRRAYNISAIQDNISFMEQLDASRILQTLRLKYKYHLGWYELNCLVVKCCHSRYKNATRRAYKKMYNTKTIPTQYELERKLFPDI